MRHTSINRAGSPGQPPRDERGSVRVILLVLVFFCLGLAASAIWFHRGPTRSPATDQGPRLSDGTKAVLDHLDGPIELRFYSLLDRNAPASLSAFSARVDRLLAAYQEQAKGKIVVIRHNAQTSSSPNAALADGIKAFNLDKGGGCFLGIALSANGMKEALAQISPEWEPALESDLSRAILRLTEAGSSGKAGATAPPTDASVTEELKRTVPNLESVSVEDGTRLLHEAALKEFTAAVSEMQAQVREAQARLEQAQNGGSTAEQESAMKHLQEVQAAQTENLRRIAANCQAQIDALKQLKASGK